MQEDINKLKKSKMKNWSTKQKTWFWIAIVAIVLFFVWEMKWLGNTTTFTGLNARQFCGGGFVGSQIQTVATCLNGYDANGNCLPDAVNQRRNVIIPERVPVVGVYS